MRPKICTIYAVLKLHGTFTNDLIFCVPCNQAGPACICSLYSNCVEKEKDFQSVRGIPSRPDPRSIKMPAKLLLQNRSGQFLMHAWSPPSRP